MATNKSNIYFRYMIIVGFIALICFAILFCMGRTIFTEGEAWRHKADSIRFRTETVPAKRGDILATDGRLLATTVPIYTMYMDMAVAEAHKDTFNRYLDPLCKALSQMPGEHSADGYRRLLTAGFQAKNKRYYRISTRTLSYMEKQQILSYPFFNKKNSNQTGIIFEEQSRRKRPFGLEAVATIGNARAAGTSGIELACDSLLRGVPGLQEKQRNRIPSQYINKTLRAPIAGKDIVTTIDADIQDMAESALMNKLIQTNADYGTAVVMEVETGAIRAIANLDKQRDGSYEEMDNHAISDFVEPGSTFKTAAMMVALDAGVVRPDDKFDTGNGLFHYAGRDMKDHNYSHGGYHEITAAQAIWYSSNIGVSKVVLRGFEREPKKFVDGLYAIGLNKAIDLHLPDASAPRIKYPTLPDGKPNPEWWKTSLPWMSFGYEVSIPPIYTLMFYNAIANDGKMITPYVIAGISEDGEMVEKFKSEVVNNRICKSQTLKEIRQMLKDVVLYGTARGKNAVGSDYVQIAGKTGTAQIHQRDAGYKGNGVRHRVSFCGYFPADNPKYSCIVVISNPRIGYPSGGTMSGAVLREIAEQLYARGFLSSDETLPTDTLLPQMPYIKNGNLAATSRVCRTLSLPCTPPETGAEWVRTTAKDNSIAMNKIPVIDNLVPSVIGMGASDALYLLEEAGLYVEIEGSGKVTKQSIPAGRRAHKGDYIRIVLR